MTRPLRALASLLHLTARGHAPPVLATPGADPCITTQRLPAATLAAVRATHGALDPSPQSPLPVSIADLIADVQKIPDLAARVRAFVAQVEAILAAVEPAAPQLAAVASSLGVAPPPAPPPA